MKTICTLICACITGTCYADVMCYLNLVKNSCWNDRVINLRVVQMGEDNQIALGSIEKNVAWKRISFSCKPSQTLYFNADFSPVFWQANKGKKYYAKQYWGLPDKLKKGDVAWQLTICFPKDFSGVPVPLGDYNGCACQYDKVTPLKLNKKK